jgi:hypothetical protein
MAHVMASKYCDHQPLYRQSGIFARSGVQLDRATLAGWVAKGDELIDPLVAAIRRHVLANDKIHGDDTPVKVLAPGTGKTRTGRLWVYVRDDRPAGDDAPRAAWFAYSGDRGGEHPQAHLRGFQGALQADAYGGWPKLYATGRVQEVACWAHARRPWWELFLRSGREPGSLAGQALSRIRALYAIEEQIRGQGPEVRKAQRQARAGPLLEDLRAWFEGLLARVSAKSDIAQAIGYSLGRWGALTRYIKNGRLEIDNNAAERALRGVSRGARTTCSWARTPEASGRRRSTAWWRRPSSTGWIRKPTCAKCSNASLSTRSTASMNCCRGTSGEGPRHEQSSG